MPRDPELWKKLRTLRIEAYGREHTLRLWDENRRDWCWCGIVRPDCDASRKLFGLALHGETEDAD